MAQVKIYALATNLGTCKTELSSVVHSCLVDALELPPDKRFQRFFSLAEDDFLFPVGRGGRYTILEIQLFEGRTLEAKKKLIRLLFERFQTELRYDVNDLEINLIETPRENWGIRGLPGDELGLTYKVEV